MRLQHSSAYWISSSSGKESRARIRCADKLGSARESVIAVTNPEMIGAQTLLVLIENSEVITQAQRPLDLPEGQHGFSAPPTAS